METLGKAEEAEPQWLDVGDVDRLGELLGDLAQQVRLPRPDRTDDERVAPPRDVLAETRALGLAADHRQLSRERSHESAPSGRGHWSPA